MLNIIVLKFFIYSNWYWNYLANNLVIIISNDYKWLEIGNLSAQKGVIKKYKKRYARLKKIL